MNIALTRLKHLHVSEPQYSIPEKVVDALVAVQGQDYAASKWAIGLRAPYLKEEDIESAFLDKKIIRSWPLRGTLHVVCSKDIYWLLDLLGPPTVSKYAAHYKKIELDPKVLKKCYSILSKNLSNWNFLTRKEISSILEKSGIITNTTRLSHILQRAGLEGLVCFGPRKDKEFTYALIEEWIPKIKRVKKPKEEALYEITKRYFDTRAPATMADFVWWSGLTVKDAKVGIESLGSKLTNFRKEDQIYYLPKKMDIVNKDKDTLFLLPAFDEFLLAYTDRKDCMDPPTKKLLTPADDLFRPILVMNGWVSGIWQRELKKDDVILKVSPYKTLNTNFKKKLNKAAEKYAGFLGKKLILEV